MIGQELVGLGNSYSCCAMVAVAMSMKTAVGTS